MSRILNIFIYNGNQSKTKPIVDPRWTKKGKRRGQGVPQSQTVALPRHQEEEETDNSKQAQIEQTYAKH